MIFDISNGIISAKINSIGAELCSLFHIANSKEYMWQADEKFWPRHSPVLFPVVGKLKDNMYYYDGHSYPMAQHGFARDKEFDLLKREEHELHFVLRDNEYSRKIYPFHFELHLSYVLKENQLIVSYKVVNTDRKILYFSLGAHPGFKIPLANDSVYEDHYLEFSEPETAERYLIEDGLISRQIQKVFEDPYHIPLSRSLFYQDALVFKHLRSDTITIRSARHSHGLKFHFRDFPYFGIWAKKDADFVCLEPWCGIADHVDANQQLTEKEGIHLLDPEGEWKREFSIEVY